MDASVTELIGLVAGCLTTGSFIRKRPADASGIDH